MREFVEGVRQDDDLIILAQLVEKGARAIHRPHLADHFLDVRQAESVLAQDAQAVLHQRVVIRLVARGATQLRNPGALGEGDPDFGDKDALKVEANDLHGILLRFGQDKQAILAKLRAFLPAPAGGGEEW